MFGMNDQKVPAYQQNLLLQSEEIHSHFSESLHMARIGRSETLSAPHDSPGTPIVLFSNVNYLVGLAVQLLFFPEKTEAKAQQEDWKRGCQWTCWVWASRSITTILFIHSTMNDNRNIVVEYQSTKALVGDKESALQGQVSEYPVML